MKKDATLLYPRAKLYEYVLIALCVLCGTAPSHLRAGESVPEFKAKHVVLLVLDGERYTETWGEPGRGHIPRSATELAPKGVFFTHCNNDGPTYTVPGHCALLNGHAEDLQGNGTDLPKSPTLFQILLANGTPPDHAWFITSKDKLTALTNCADPMWKDKFIARSDCGKSGAKSGNRDDAETMAVAREVMLKHSPRFMALNLKDPDVAGHANDWDGYLKSITACDALAADFWNWIQAQPALANQTALIITNDHGRHIDGRLQGFISHGDGCSGCRHIGCLALGPDFKQNAVIHERHNQFDIAATMAAILGVKLVNSDGKMITELFEQPAAKSGEAQK